MGLPAVIIAREKYPIGDEKVEIHAVSSAQSYDIKRLLDAEDLAEATVLTIAYGTDTPVDEVRKWCTTTPPGIVEPLASRIGELSALDGSELSKSGPSAVHDGGG